MNLTTKNFRVLGQGKTKKLWERRKGNQDLIYVESNNMLTAGNGERADELPGKGEWSTRITSLIFEVLKNFGIPVAYTRQIGPRVFEAKYCGMLPFEVVARRHPLGSYLKRHPDMPRDHSFEVPFVEWFLKTNDQVWKGQPLTVDDPFVQFVQGKPERMLLFRPDQPLHLQTPMLELDRYPLQGNVLLRQEIEDITRRVFLILEWLYELLGYNLVDFKLEFGITPDGELVVADVIDPDGFRLLNKRGEHRDKQLYRNRVALEIVAAAYLEVMEATEQFPALLAAA